VKQNNIVCLLLIIVISCTTRGPILQIDTQDFTAIDTVAAGSTAVRQLVLHNKGDAPLIIEDFLSSCNCTSFDITKGLTIRKGESRIVKINITADSSKLKRLNDIVLTFKTNASPAFYTIEKAFYIE